MEKIHRRELKAISTSKVLQNLADAFEDCRRRFKPKPTSGLMELQAWFRESKLPSG